MKVIQTAVYEGPNIYAPVPVIRWRIDLGTLEDWPTGRLGAAFTDALLDRLPGLGGHGASEGAPGDFAGAMADKDGVPLGQVMAHAVLALQRLGGAEVEFAEARSAGAPGIHDVICGSEEAMVGIGAGRLALALIGHLLPSELRPEAGVSPGFDFAGVRDTFIRFATERSLNYNTVPMVKAAEERGIPWTRLGNNPFFIQLGHGRFRKRISQTMTSDAGAIAMRIAENKALTVRVLGELGLPVPRQQLVASEHEAVRAAERVGYPVVVKPKSLHKGVGVSVHLVDAGEVRAAFARARGYGTGVLVEGFIEGNDHRMLVAGGELIAATKRVPAHVVGDGVHTVEELMQEVNRDSRRGAKHLGLLVHLELDEETERVLAGTGYTGKTVPANGETIALCRTANISTGGTAVDMTDRVHPDNRIMAIRAVEAVGLVIAGIDFITPDIGR